MYALFFNTYGYNANIYRHNAEYHDLIAVSEDAEKLKELIDDKHPVLEGAEQDIADTEGRSHYVIEPVKLV